MNNDMTKDMILTIINIKSFFLFPPEFLEATPPANATGTAKHAEQNSSLFSIYHTTQNFISVCETK